MFLLLILIHLVHQWYFLQFLCFFQLSSFYHCIQPKKEIIDIKNLPFPPTLKCLNFQGQCYVSSFFRAEVKHHILPFIATIGSFHQWHLLQFFWLICANIATAIYKSAFYFKKSAIFFNTYQAIYLTFAGAESKD